MTPQPHQKTAPHQLLKNLLRELNRGTKDERLMASKIEEAYKYEFDLDPETKRFVRAETFLPVHSGEISDRLMKYQKLNAHGSVQIRFRDWPEDGQWIQFTDIQTNIVHVFIPTSLAKKMGLVDRECVAMWSAAKCNLENLEEGKIKLGKERVCVEEIEHQLQYVRNQPGRVLKRRLKAWETFHGWN